MKRQLFKLALYATICVLAFFAIAVGSQVFDFAMFHYQTDVSRNTMPLAHPRCHGCEVRDHEIYVLFGDTGYRISSGEAREFGKAIIDAADECQD